MALFLPTLVIGVGYFGLWLYLHMGGRGSGGLSRVSVAVLMLGIPLLLAHAGLRLATTRVTLLGTHLEVHPGFPASDPVLLGYREISFLRLRRGLSGVLTGTASLIIDLETGRRVVVPALQDPEEVMAAIEARRASIGFRVVAPDADS